MLSKDVGFYAAGEARYNERRPAEEFVMKKIEAIVKPFKLGRSA